MTFPTTPDMVSEVRVMTSSYEPEYGTTTGGEIIVTTRSGTNQFHGGGFEYFRNKDLNALQFTNDRGPGNQRPKDNENQFGGFIGGPVKIPLIPLVWGPNHKTYFFFDAEYLRSLGGASPPLVVDSLRPGTHRELFRLNDSHLRSNQHCDSIIGVLSRAQYPGNIIPTSQQSPLALQWMKYLPATTSPGPINNFLGQPVSDGILSNLDEYLIKIDHYWGEHDHFFATIWRQLTQPNEQCIMPVSMRSGLTWPEATVQTCVVHMVRNSLRYASKQHWARITTAMREIYTAPTVEAAEARFPEFAGEVGTRATLR